MANPEIAYKNLMREYLAIQEINFTHMNRAREVIIAESLQLASYSAEDIGEFSFIPRFNTDLIATLPERIEGFIHADNQFVLTDSGPGTAKGEWIVLEPEAEKIKQKFITRRTAIATEEGDVTTLKEIGKIKPGYGRKDLQRDISNINAMAKRDAEKLASIGLDATFLKRLDEINTKLQTLIADMKRLPEGYEEKKKMVFRAYTYLMQAVTPICDYGQMIFEGTPRAELYKSATLSENASGNRVSGSEESKTAPSDSGLGL